ncbi:MAG: hypothetical protein LBH50_00335 [Spirochaetaceae bacterium]|nr:hypothetical protein [Spirochaetaceae bacterium]
MTYPIYLATESRSVPFRQFGAVFKIFNNMFAVYYAGSFLSSVRVWRQRRGRTQKLNACRVS